MVPFIGPIHRFTCVSARHSTQVAPRLPGGEAMHPILDRMEARDAPHYRVGNRWLVGEIEAIAPNLRPVSREGDLITHYVISNAGLGCVDKRDSRRRRLLNQDCFLRVSADGRRHWRGFKVQRSSACTFYLSHRGKDRYALPCRFPWPSGSSFCLHAFGPACAFRPALVTCPPEM